MFNKQDNECVRKTFYNSLEKIDDNNGLIK